VIYLSLPGIPPSSNHAYFNLPKGGRALTPAGKKYKNETTAYLAQTYRAKLMAFRPNVGFQIFFRFTVESIENKLWKPGGKVNRYKKFDGGNLTKLLEDCLKDVGGIDDSQTLTSLWQKKAGPVETTEVWAWDLALESDPFDLDFMLEQFKKK
jgi:hypothetical protein